MFGLGYGIAVLGIALGLGIIGYSALQGMARQPEAIGKLQTVMLIALAFVELTFFLTLFLAPGLVNKVPAGETAAVSAPATNP